MNFCQRFVDIFERVGGDAHIEDFAKRVDPNKIGFGSRKNFYSPVQFHVQAGPAPYDVIRVNVPVYANEENWMKELKTNLAACLGGRMENAENIQLKTVTGRPLETITNLSDLEHVGKLHMYVNGAPKRLPKMPENIPLEYSVTKQQELQKWIEQSFLAEVIPVVTTMLAKVETPQELEQALSGDGSVKAKVKDLLFKSTKGDWKQFVKTFHPEGAAKYADKIAENVADDVLTMVRHYVEAAGNDISHHIQSKIAFDAASKNKKDHYRPLLKIGGSSSGGGGGGGTTEGGYNMYHRLIDDALTQPMLVSSIFNSIHDYYEPVNKKTTVVVPLAENTHHPWNTLIHHDILPIKGQYPVDYLKRHLKQDMSAKAKYVGTEARTYQMFHLFSGNHQAPPSRFINPNPQYGVTGIANAALIDRKHGNKSFSRNKKKKSTTNGAKSGFDKGKNGPNHSPFPFEKGMETELLLPELVPISDEMIDCHCAGGEDKKKKKKDKSRWMKDSVVTDFVDSELPELVPLVGARLGAHPLGIDAELPELVPISAADETIDCHCTTDGDDKKKKKKKKDKMRWMKDPIPEFVSGDIEPIDDDFSDFPTVENVFKQTTNFV